MTDDLVAWLRAELDEDERVAKALRESDRRWRLLETESPEDGVEYTLDLGDGRDYKFVGWDEDISRAEAAHIARHDPARVLAEVAAKRRIIELHQPYAGVAHSEAVTNCRLCGPDSQPFQVRTWGDEWPCLTLRLLASVYAGRPGWQSEWAPDEEENHG